MKNILKNSFWQLIAIYSAIILVIALGFLGKYTLYFNILALIIAILGISIISKETPINSKINLKSSFSRFNLILFTVAIILILLFRILPYWNNSIPIGYDAGIYKYGIEQFKQNGFQVQDWIKGSMSPLFLYLMYPLSFLFSTNLILTYLFIIFNLILGISIYFFTKEYFNVRNAHKICISEHPKNLTNNQDGFFDKNTALIAILIYSVSIIQFKVFEFLYYKNIIALSLMLFSLYFLKKDRRACFIIFASLTGAMHLPTFYIFGLSYFFYAFISPINNKQYNLKLLKKNIINGLLIITLTLFFYLGFIHQAILPLISPLFSQFTQTGTASGTFLSFFQYQFLTLAYLPFAILGFFALAKNRKFNMLFFLALITASIVYFQLFFFNRFIIHLDILLIILASLGFSVIIENKKKLGIIILAIMLFSAGMMTFNESIKTKPGITQEQLTLIQQLHTTEQASTAISISSEYSPYVLAYSGRKTIAPGLFDTNWTRAEWGQFWQGDIAKTKELLSQYSKPVYLFAGARSLNNSCFSLFLKEGDNKIYKYEC